MPYTEAISRAKWRNNWKNVVIRGGKKNRTSVEIEEEKEKPCKQQVHSGNYYTIVPHGCLVLRRWTLAYFICSARNRFKIFVCFIQNASTTTFSKSPSNVRVRLRSFCLIVFYDKISDICKKIIRQNIFFLYLFFHFWVIPAF